MLKEERHRIILDILRNNSVISNSEIMERTSVTEMTIRRDLKELENNGKLIRIHGGAKSSDNNPNTVANIDNNHIIKRGLNTEQKKYVAKLVANQINDNDTVFLGSGTTLELVYDYLNSRNVHIVTNSMLVFDKFKLDPNFDTILIGGVYRNVSASFHGTITDIVAENFHVKKAFISANGIHNNSIFDAVAEEGLTQRIIFDNAAERYLAIDSSKFDTKDFYEFYTTEKIDYIITDDKINQSIMDQYSSLTKIIFK